MEKSIELLVHGPSVVMEVHFIRQNVLRVDAAAHSRRPEHQVVPGRARTWEGGVVHRIVIIFLLVWGRVLLKGEIPINAQRRA